MVPATRSRALKAAKDLSQPANLVTSTGQSQKPTRSAESKVEEFRGKTNDAGPMTKKKTASQTASKPASRSTRTTRANKKSSAALEAPSRATKRKRAETTNVEAANNHIKLPNPATGHLASQSAPFLRASQSSHEDEATSTRQPAIERRPRRGAISATASKEPEDDPSCGIPTKRRTWAAAKPTSKTSKKQANNKIARNGATQVKETKAGVGEAVVQAANTIEGVEGLGYVTRFMEHLQGNGLAELRRRLGFERSEVFSVDGIPLAKEQEYQFLRGFKDGQDNPQLQNDHAEPDKALLEAADRGTSSPYYNGFLAGKGYTGQHWQSIFTESAKMGLPAADFIALGCSIVEGEASVPDNFEFERSHSTYDPSSRTMKTITVHIERALPNSTATVEHPPKRVKRSATQTSAVGFDGQTASKGSGNDMQLPSLAQNDESSEIGFEARTSILDSLFIERPPVDAIRPSSRAGSYDPFSSDEEILESFAAPTIDTSKPSLSAMPYNSFAPPPPESIASSQAPNAVIAPIPQASIIGTAPRLSSTDLLFELKPDHVAGFTAGLPPQISGTSHISPERSPVLKAPATFQSMPMSPRYHTLPGLGTQHYMQAQMQAQEGEIWSRAGQAERQAFA